MDHEPDKFYLTLGLKAYKAFLDIPDTTKPYFEQNKLIWTYGENKIQAYGAGNTFLVNYYGPRLV